MASTRRRTPHAAHNAPERPAPGGSDAQRALAARLRQLLASAEPRAADHHGGEERPLQDLPREDRAG